MKELQQEVDMLEKQRKALEVKVETLTQANLYWQETADRMNAECERRRLENDYLARQLAEVKVSVHANVPGIGPDWVLLDRKTWERVFAATMSYCQGCADRDRQIETLTRQLAEAREALNLAAGYMRDRADPLPEHMAKVDAALSADRPAREGE